MLVLTTDMVQDQMMILKWTTLSSSLIVSSERSRGIGAWWNHTMGMRSKTQSTMASVFARLAGRGLCFFGLTLSAPCGGMGYCLDERQPREATYGAE